VVDLADLEAHIDRRAQHSAWPITVFTGAGSSIDSGLPGWERLIAQVIADLANQLRQRPQASGNASMQRDLSRQLQAVSESIHWVGATWFDNTEERAQLASVLALRLARTMTNSGVAAVLNPIRNDLIRQAVIAALPQVAPGPLANALGHKLAAPSALQLVVTTNWDNLIETAVGNAQPAIPGPILQVPSLVALVPQVGLALPVVHLHGLLEAGCGGWPTNQDLVFSRADFLNFARQQPAPRWQEEMVKTCFIESTCLFIGTSVSDLNYQRWIFERSQRRYARRGRPVEQIAGRNDPQCVIVFRAESFTGLHLNEQRTTIANRWAEWRTRVIFLTTAEIQALINHVP